MSFRKALKEQAKLRLALCGLAGSGKTFTALAIADAIAKMMRERGHGAGRIAVIDTERGSASLYANKFDFDVCELDSFSPLTYVAKIKEAEQAGYDFIVLDSLSHAWAGKDGALDQKDQAAERSGNSWTAWRNVSPKHNALVDAMLGSRAHVAATMRVKMEHVQETVNGKTEIKKVGLASIQREGMDYEFTLVGDIDHTHTLKVTKTRLDGVVALGEQFEKPGADLARKIYGWLLDGAAPRPREVPVTKPVAPPTELATAIDIAFANFLLGIETASTQAELDAAVQAPGRPTKDTPEHKRAGDAFLARQDWIKAKAKSEAA